MMIRVQSSGAKKRQFPELVSQSFAAGLGLHARQSEISHDDLLIRTINVDVVLTCHQQHHIVESALSHVLHARFCGQRPRDVNIAFRPLFA